MDLVLLMALFAVVVLILLSTIFLLSRPGEQKKAEPRPANQEADRPRRANVVRNQRNRLRAQGRHDEPEEQQESDNEQTQINDEKMGAKKRAKMEAKAEKKAARELEEKRREEAKKKEQQQKLEREKIEEKMKLEEQKIEEEKKRLQEEKEKREHEEYLKMKEAFLVEEEGYEQGDEENEQSLQSFINYIKNNKVIVIEDLAVMYKLKTQACIDRIQDLQNDNILSGVMDDRGKYIYISEDELTAFANFIKQRGRVSISELADGSNRIINLQPNQILAS